MGKRRQNKDKHIQKKDKHIQKKDKHIQQLNPSVAEATRIKISRILEEFREAKDEGLLLKLIN